MNEVREKSLACSGMSRLEGLCWRALRRWDWGPGGAPLIAWNNGQLLVDGVLALDSVSRVLHDVCGVVGGRVVAMVVQI